MNILTTTQLTKRFGDQKVIDGLTLSVPEGTIFGFIGQNGAGKTTTMKMVLGLLNADGGEITVCGEPVTYGQVSTNRQVGYLPDVPEFYNYMKPQEYLSLCGEIIGLSPAEIKKRSQELLTLVGLDGVKKRIGGFSRGMKQRFGIAQALLTRPKLLICDEPTSALDPVGRKEILDILQRIKGSTTVLFSTHILTDVERVCDRVALLHGGKIAASGTLGEIKAQYGRDSLLVAFATEEELARLKDCEAMGPLLDAADLGARALELHGSDLEQIQRTVIAVLATLGLCPEKMERKEPSLEELFLEVVK